MKSRRVPVWLYLIDKVLPLLLLLGFLPFFAYYLHQDPGVFLTSWVTFAIIAMAAECIFSGIGDRVREWRHKQRLTTEHLEQLESDGKMRLFQLRAAIIERPEGSTVVHDLVEDIEEIVEKMRLGIDWKLTTRTNLWNIAVYGLSSVVSFNVLDAAAPGFYVLPWYVRGACFAPTIFLWELCWGWAIEKLIGICPWRYKRSLVRWRRYIKPHYAAFWFGFGFVLEWTHLHLVPLIVSSFNVLPGR